jgi:hypothetical protein
MIYFLALIPATALTVAGYCVLYVSHHSEGSFRSFGKYLGFWAFSLAGLVILGAIFLAAHGPRYDAMMRDRGRFGMMHRPWGGEMRFPGMRFGARDAVPPSGDGRPGDGRPDDARPGDVPPRPAPQSGTQPAPSSAAR